jgi:uncharacterized ubiquitin-like protein YukD
MISPEGGYTVAEIEVTIRTKSKMIQDRLPADAPVGSLLPSIIRKLGLPTSGEGKKIIYKLADGNTGKILSDNDTLANAGINQNDFLKIVQKVVDEERSKEIQMKESGYTEVSWSSSGIVLLSTHPQVIDWVLLELKRLIPSYQIRFENRLFSGERYFCQLERLEKKDEQVWWWIVRQLTLQGWEPFEIFRKDWTDFERQAPNTIYLRFKGD